MKKTTAHCVEHREVKNIGGADKKSLNLEFYVLFLTATLIRVTSCK